MNAQARTTLMDKSIHCFHRRSWQNSRLCSCMYVMNMHWYKGHRSTVYVCVCVCVCVCEGVWVCLRGQIVQPLGLIRALL